MEDAKLLRLLQKDPNAGMEQLMDQYAGLVYAVIKGRLADFYHVSSDIEDCVADVFSKFYADIASYDPKLSGIKSYLCVIARNLAINLAKKRSHQQGAVSFDDESAIRQIPDDLLIDSELAETELRREVLTAVKDLGQPDTDIILRKYYFGESSKEIAAALKLTVSNVDTRAHRALNKLKKMFGGKEV